MEVNPSTYNIEVCVETLQEALEAQARGANQIELCSDLDKDGLTPPKGLIQSCLRNIDIHMKVMIRPRDGNFEYSVEELNQMADSISMCKELGVKEVVFGILKAGALDLTTIQSLVHLSSPMDVCIHKAIDTCDDPVREMKRLSEMAGIKSVLTSGGASTAQEGVTTLLQMKEYTNPHFGIIAAGKILPDNLEDLHRILELSYYHGRKILGNLSE